MDQQHLSSITSGGISLEQTETSTMRIEQLFAAQVALSPNAIAVDDGRRTLTYAEVDERSTALAVRILAASSVAELTHDDQPVGVCVRRDVDMVVTLLAVLKAGRSYLPLDTDYPAERLAYLVADANVKTVIGHREHLNSLPSGPETLIVVDDTPTSNRFAFADLNKVNATDRSAAYVLYTSGSTGKPKGVVIEHRSVVQLIRWSLQFYDAGELATVAASTSLSFDLSVWEIFVPLSAGHTIRIFSNALEIDDQTNISLLNTVPSALDELIRAGRLPQSLRTINVAGEALTADLVRRAYALPRVNRLVNLYGPTEATVYTTAAVMQADASNVPTIGSAIDGTETLVIIDNKVAYSPGMEGELCLAGNSLGRGYLHQPELTEQRFVRHPLQPGKLMYRTGDLVRIRQDRGLDFLGRIDNQIKVRGYRVELGEVEDALLRHDVIQQVAVAPKLNELGTVEALVAFFTTSAGSISGVELRNHCRRLLPEHCIPSAFIQLENIPRTTNGKIARNILMSLASDSHTKSEGAGSKPRGATETRISQLMSSLLRIDRPISRDEDFFDLGGTSLMGLRLLVDLENSFGVRLTTSVLFREPTIAGFARALIDCQGPKSTPVMTIQEGTSTDTPPMFLLVGWFCQALWYRSLQPHLPESQTVYGISPQHVGEGLNPAATIEEMAARSVALIKSIQPSGPYRIGGHSLGGLISWETARLLSSSGETVELVVLMDTETPKPPTRIVGRHARWILGQLRRRQWNIAGRYAQQLFYSKLVAPWLERLRPTNLEDDPSWVLDDANYNAAIHYSPEPASTPLLLLCSKDWRDADGRKFLGWHGIANGPIKEIVIPGGHFSLFDEPNVTALGRALSDFLE